MKKLLLTKLLIGIAVPLFAQYAAKVNEGKADGDINIKISSDVHFEDLSVKVSHNVDFEDITIRFTDFEREADLIISDSSKPDFKVNMVSNFEDLVILTSNNINFEDIGIEIRKSGRVDYLVYSDLDLLSREMLVCAMLPIINLHLDEKDKLKGIPTYKKRSNTRYTDNESVFVEPMFRTQIDEKYTGTKGETVFKFANGQEWQQVSPHHIFHCAHKPEVKIYETTEGFFMEVDGFKKRIEVKEVNKR